MKITDLLTEAPIEFDPQEPMNPMIYGAGANPAKLQYRMQRAANQLKDLAERAEDASPIEWESIYKNFDELVMNMSQIKHGLEELVKLRKKGGVKSRGIDKAIGEKMKFAGDSAGQKTGDAGQVKGQDRAKRISPVLGAPEKAHPFKGKLVGGGA